MDNYGARKHLRVQNWLKRNPRFIAHYIPTSSNGRNLVEHWFGKLTGKRIRRDACVSVEELKQAIKEFLAGWKAVPRPFERTVTVKAIMVTLVCCEQALERITPGCIWPRIRKTKGKQIQSFKRHYPGDH